MTICVCRLELKVMRTHTKKYESYRSHERAMPSEGQEVTVQGQRSRVFARFGLELTHLLAKGMAQT